MLLIVLLHFLNILGIGLENRLQKLRALYHSFHNHGLFY